MISLLRVFTLLWGLSQMTDLVLTDDAGGLCPLGCFQGKCTAPSICQCEQGWTNLLNTTVLPCVVPNCNLNLSCAPDQALSPPPPPPPRVSISVCAGVNCGGGTCMSAAFPIPFIGFRCDCNPGYGNLFNFSAAPCVEQCGVFASCTDLGLGIGAPPPPTAPGTLNSTGNIIPGPPPIASPSSSLGAGSQNAGYTHVVRLSSPLILTIISIGLLMRL